MRCEAYQDKAIEAHRRRLKQDETLVPALDLGAGSQGNTSTVAAIARQSLKRPKHARALAALMRHVGGGNALELGTSLGLTTAYLASHANQVVTVEGNPSIAAVASEVWTALGKTNIHSIVGGFDEQWHALANTAGSYDLLFIDGNHRGDALRRYVEAGLKLLRPGGVIVCDDIHWSQDMEVAWQSLCEMEAWTLRVDAYEWGLLTQNPALKREHVCVRF